VSDNLQRRLREAEKIVQEEETTEEQHKWLESFKLMSESFEAQLIFDQANNITYLGDMVCVELKDSHNIDWESLEVKKEIVRLYQLHLSYPLGIYPPEFDSANRMSEFAMKNRRRVMRLTGADDVVYLNPNMGFYVE
jgi:hypothetical protein